MILWGAGLYLGGDRPGGVGGGLRAAVSSGRASPLFEVPLSGFSPALLVLALWGVGPVDSVCGCACIKIGSFRPLVFASLGHELPLVSKKN